MSSRKIKVNGVMTKFSFDKNKKYKYNSSGNVVEATTVSDDDIVLSGSKSSLRRMSDMERNISILATKTVTTAGALDVSIDEVDGLQTALNAKATPANVSTSLNSAKAYTDTKVADLVSSAPGTLNTLNELAAALGDNPNFATTVTNNLATKLPLSGGTMTGNLDLGGNNLVVDTAKGITNSGAWTRISNPNGYIEFGPANSSWAHIYSSGPNFYFNRELFVNNKQVFNTGFHPNADKWTTARTLTLSGDASGSVSWDGSGNATLSVAVADNSHNHSNYQAAGDYVGGGEYHNFGGISIGSTVTTTALLIADLTSKGFFSHSHSVGKCSWSYAGNGDLTDTGFGTFELAGCVVETFYEGGNKTVRITRPNTGGDGPSVLVYNDQGNGTYSPGWREMVTSYGGNTNITGNLTATGDITAYSDDSLKTNVQVIDGALGKVEAIRGVTFDRIENGETSTGVIAQELEAVLPEAVKTDANGVRHVAYGNITGLLIEAVKELSAQVEELKNKK